MYITFNDGPSGIYSSQVVDVCKFIRDRWNVSILLVAFISLRGFSESRKKIKQSGVRSWVLPMFPKPKNWRKNRVTLRMIVRFFKPDIIVGRGPFAASLALTVRRKSQRVVFDGRGAYDAEFKEYDVSGSSELRNEIATIEKNAVLNSDMRIAVSNNLVDYWAERYGYIGAHGEDLVVIPCTLNTAISESTVMPKRRSEFGWSDQDIIVIYSGSSAGWQSLRQLDEIMYPLMKSQPNIRLLLLTSGVPSDFRLTKEFGDRVKLTWVKHADVAAVLAMADYGWLVREESVTNRVSSPVKFAEYLFAGLKVITSSSMGDNAEFVSTYNAGIITGSDGIPKLESVSDDEKLRIHLLAMDHYTKNNYESHYRRITEL